MHSFSHSLIHSRRHSRKGRNSAILLLGATALSLGLTHQVSAQAATTGGGSLVSPVTGTLATPPVSPVTNPLTGLPGPSYGLGGLNMVLVKNWEFGKNGNITNYDDMSREFQYHDQFGGVDNGDQYGSNAAAPDVQNSTYVNDLWLLLYRSYSPQPIEGINLGYGPIVPQTRDFGSDYLRTYLVPEGSDATVTPYGHEIADGSFTAKWSLPNGGSLLGQDIVWETRVRYVMAPAGKPPLKYFWFALWNAGQAHANGAENDLVESYGEDYGAGIGYGTNNFDGHLWHSDMFQPRTPSNQIQESEDYEYNGGFWGAILKQLGYDSFVTDKGTSAYNPYDATQYHIWTWVYHSDDTYEMYVDGTKVQSNVPGATCPWTLSSAPPQAVAIDNPPQAGTPLDVRFLFSAAWGNTGISGVNGSINLPGDLMPPSSLTADDGVFYEFNYSRVYLKQGTVSEAAFNNATPALPSPQLNAPVTIHFSDYDTGGEGSGYHIFSPATAANGGQTVHRGDNNGDVYVGGGPGGNGYFLGDSSVHDWYKYTVNVTATAGYTAAFQVNSWGFGGGTFHVEDEDGNDLTGKMTVPDTSGSGQTNWTTISSPAFLLNAGTHTLRLVEDTPGAYGFVCDFDWMQLAAATNTANAVNLANPDFETPYIAVSAGGYLYNPPAAGWTFSGNAGLTTGYNRFGTPSFPNPIAPATNNFQVAFLEGTTPKTSGTSSLSQSGGTPGSISQTLSLAAGTYTLSYNAAQTGNQSVQVYVDPTFSQGVRQGGIPVGAPSIPSGGFGSPATVYTVTFTVGINATSMVYPPGLHTITLAATNLGDNTAFVDNVSLKYVKAVPQMLVITNPSFETPVVSNANNLISGSDPAIAPAVSGWNFNSASGIIANYGALSNPPSPDGNQAAFLQQGGAISQAVQFPSDGSYTLTLQAAESGYDSENHLVQVLVDGNSAGFVTPLMTGKWATGTFPITIGTNSPNASTHTITLQGVSSDGSFFADFVDQVAITSGSAPMAGTVFSGPVAAQAAHLASFGGLSALSKPVVNPPTAAFDSNVGTFFDYAQSSGGYVGLSLTAARSVSKINYAPRVGYEKRMVGGVFEGSNTSATTGYTTLATVTATPRDGTGKTGMTNTLTVTNHTAFKWLRYRGPASGYCDVAEIQFLH